MAPRRNTAGSTALELFGIDTDLSSQTSVLSDLNGSALSSATMRCSVPTGDCYKSDHLNYGFLHGDDMSEAVRVLCNNENCTVGQYMHRECFEQWEQTILSYLKSNGRARSWSDRQRQQNLWTKKGYDLAFKACNCKCGRGHLKKDLDWVPPQASTSSIFGRIDDEANKKKKKRMRNNQKPSLAASANVYESLFTKMETPSTIRGRAGSLSSSNGSSSPAASSSEQSTSPIHNLSLSNCSPHLNNITISCNSSSSSGISPGSLHSTQSPKSQVEIYSDKIRATSGANGIFSRRLDFSSFNVLPKQRINSYSIKIEDEGNHGNDETRLFILSSLAAQHKSRVACVLCEEPMLVFDRYPLVDGTFFLSPKQHAQGCIEVKYDERSQYLNSVCMACLEGGCPSRVVRCRFCAEKWDGSSLVLGTMYSYDIFAAMPCCSERLKCNTCFKLILHPQQRLNFYSDYSHSVSCPCCCTQDTHFIKPLSYCYTKRSLPMFQPWP